MLRTTVAVEREQTAAPSAAERETRVEPPRMRFAFDLASLWEYRQLLYFLAWRDIKVRYKQTLLGVGWALLQPFLATIVFTIFFGRVAHLSSQGIPYALFAFAAMLPWTYFSNAVVNGSSSLVVSSSIVTKIYFPRSALPIATIAGAAVDFACAAVLLVPLFAWYGETPTVRVLALPLFFLLATVAALGIALLFAAMSVRYRDVRFIVPFLMQIWLFATPVVYSAASLGATWRIVYAFNPMVGVVEGFRWSLFGLAPAPGWTTAASVASALVALAVGALYFRNVEQSLADVI
jgi:lipopolysaccharide transport system permease protein